MRNLAALALLFLLAAPAGAKGNGLVVKVGESWTFSLSNGQPVKARRAKASDKPTAGRIHVSVRSMMGTTMTISSAGDQPYVYRAELIGAPGKGAARSCTLPAGGKISFEHWPAAATAIRLSNFRPAPRDGNCP